MQIPQKLCRSVLHETILGQMVTLIGLINEGSLIEVV